ncbi:MAG TPA: hypothetical protein VLI92_00985 [Candidatus Saccharimonadales bacterium]|nr:hypothetical protein [Candidatus Saccharimonadales bacterium]
MTIAAKPSVLVHTVTFAEFDGEVILNCFYVQDQESPSMLHLRDDGISIANKSQIPQLKTIKLTRSNTTIVPHQPGWAKLRVRVRAA